MYIIWIVRTTSQTCIYILENAVRNLFTVFVLVHLIIADDQHIFLSLTSNISVYCAFLEKPEVDCETPEDEGGTCWVESCWILFKSRETVVDRDCIIWNID